MTIHVLNSRQLLKFMSACRITSCGALVLQMREEREKDAAKQQRQSAERCAALQAEVDELHSQLGSLRFSNKSAHETLETKCAEAQSRWVT